MDIFKSFEHFPKLPSEVRHFQCPAAQQALQLRLQSTAPCPNGQITSIHVTSTAGTGPSLHPFYLTGPQTGLSPFPRPFSIHRQNDHSETKKTFCTSHDIAPAYPSDLLACHPPHHSLCASLALLFQTHTKLVLRASILVLSSGRFFLSFFLCKPSSFLSSDPRGVFPGLQLKVTPFL